MIHVKNGKAPSLHFDVPEHFLFRYHGDCIQISEKEAKNIKQYYCIRCREEDPTLVSKWKTKREKDDNYTVKTDTEERKSRKRKERGENKNDKKVKKCGECMGCYRTEDCGRCEVCTRKNRHGSLKNKERCKQRICVNALGG